MRTGGQHRLPIMAAVVLLIGCAASAQDGLDELESAFEGARKVVLRTSKVSSVVALRDVVKIPPPAEPVLVQTFKRNELPSVIKPAFARPEVAGATIAKRFIAIIHTDLEKEYEDVLRHELVHAYINLVSPKPLPFWFQEGCAVYFSTGKTRKFYGEPSKKQVGVMVGKTVELDPVYKQKLRSFQYLAKTAGEARFRRWLREAVMSGNVEPRELLGVTSPSRENQPSFRKQIPAWLIVAVAAVVIAVIIIGFYASRRDEGYY